MGNDVRFAVQDDLDDLTASLADAFRDDPMMTWIYPDAATRPEMLPAFMRVAIDIAFPHGHVYATAGNGAAALWSPPDVDLFDDDAVSKMFTLLGEQLGDRSADVGTGLMKITAEHPHDEPHFYLFVLGTASAHQSKGLGSALVSDVLERCDRQGMGAYLESSNIRNVPFYERHGFKVMSEIEVSDDFVARPMWRDPR
jgi:ribosomal protein S18 acetylase RimI-like enzyme